MILIAPDKYKGTLSAFEAARIIASACARPFLLAPMADGGEGTACVLCRGDEWMSHGKAFINTRTAEAVIDSSAVIGLQGVDLRTHNILTASSAPLGREVRRLLDYGCTKVKIGIGGTCTCDGGAGFLEALGDYAACKDRLLGLSDVQVPLLAPAGRPSALMFAPQKGATDEMLYLLADKLARVEGKYGPGHSPYDGAGGGLGYALASVIGCEVVSGAAYVLDSYGIDWGKIDLVVTGEGRYDSQTLRGKVVQAVRSHARSRGIPVVVLAGSVAQEGVIAADLLSADETMTDAGTEIVACDKFLPDSPLTPATAATRLYLAAQSVLGERR